MGSSRLSFRYCSAPIAHASLPKKLAIPECQVCSPSSSFRATTHIMLRVQASVYIDALRLSAAPELGQHRPSKIGARFLLMHLGVRARRSICKGQYIGLYSGRVYPSSHPFAAATSSYLFNIDEDQREAYVADASQTGNVGQFTLSAWSRHLILLDPLLVCPLYQPFMQSQRLFRGHSYARKDPRHWNLGQVTDQCGPVDHDLVLGRQSRGLLVIRVASHGLTGFL
jgi:hypothetical protein